MKRFLMFFMALAFAVGFLPLNTQAYEELTTGAKACIIYDADSGRILGGQNINETLPMASTTKIMTALLTLEHGNLDEWFIVDNEAIKVEGSSMGLQEKDEVTLRTLVYGMLLPSGNDAANAAAVRISGTKEDFVKLMNQKADELGLENTSFKNPSGLDAEGHYSTALDMAKLCAIALENEDFRNICGLSKAQVTFGAPPYDRWLENYNKLLTLYPYAIGVKTGFTEAAYRCLVSAAEKDGKRLICVTLNCADDWAVHERLYEEYFPRLETINLKDYIPSTLSMMDGGKLAVEISGKEKVSKLKGEEINCEIIAEQLLFSPIGRSSVVGEARFYADEELLFTRELCAAEDIPLQTEEKVPSLLDRMTDFIIQLFS